MNAENELNFKSIPKEMLAFMSAFFREIQFHYRELFFSEGAAWAESQKLCGWRAVVMIVPLWKVKEMLKTSYRS